MFEVYLPGTGGMKPLPDRFLTGLWAEHEGRALLIDCGEGMQVALAKISRSLAKLDMLLITHFHADHIAGLPGLLLSAGNFGKTSPLKIYAPEGGAAVIRNICCICGGLPFPLEIHEITGGSFLWGDIEINAMPVRHRVKTFCYSLTEHRKAVFSPEKAKAAGVPMSLWKTLHSGNTAEADGRVFTPEMVTGGQRRPLKVTYITDTVYFEGLATFAKGSDLLVSEGMYGSDEYRESMNDKQHMLFSDSAKIAKLSGSGELWLTHYSPALNEPADFEGDVKMLFENTVVSRDGIHKTIK